MRLVVLSFSLLTQLSFFSNCLFVMRRNNVVKYIFLFWLARLKMSCKCPKRWCRDVVVSTVVILIRFLTIFFICCYNGLFLKAFKASSKISDTIHVHTHTLLPLHIINHLLYPTFFTPSSPIPVFPTHNSMVTYLYLEISLPALFYPSFIPLILSPPVLSYHSCLHCVYAVCREEGRTALWLSSTGGESCCG